MKRIGLISDTHKLLRPQAVEFLRGCDAIVHAGDLVTPDALTELARIAAVTAVRGNNDKGDWAGSLQDIEMLDIDGVRILVIHDLAALSPAILKAQVPRVVVSGHSHRPRVEEHGGVLYVNPGSAGPRRFSLPVSVGELRVDNGQVQARVAVLDV